MELTSVDAASLSALQQSNVNSQVGVRVAKLTQDAAKAEGEAAVALIRAAAEAGPGRLDVRA